MKSYNITIPAFTLVVTARSRQKALEQFWFDYDGAQEDSGWGIPIIKEIKKPTWTKKSEQA